MSVQGWKWLLSLGVREGERGLHSLHHYHSCCRLLIWGHQSIKAGPTSTCLGLSAVLS